MRSSIQPKSGAQNDRRNSSQTHTNVQTCLRNNLYKSYEKPVERLTSSSHERGDDSKQTRKHTDQEPLYNNFTSNLDSLEHTIHLDKPAYSPESHHRQKSSSTSVNANQKGFNSTGNYQYDTKFGSNTSGVVPAPGGYSKGSYTY